MVHALIRLRLRRLRSVIAEVSSGLGMRSGIYYKGSGVRKHRSTLEHSVAFISLRLAGGWRFGWSVEEQFEHAKAEAAGTHSPQLLLGALCASDDQNNRH